MTEPRTVGILTAGGLAPCLASAVGGLIEAYTARAPDIELRCYLDGYRGLLTGDTIPVTSTIRERAAVLHHFGGSPIGNSRIKLTNAADCVRRGLVPEGVDPREVAARQLISDGIDVLHTIGGDDTNTAAADLARFLAAHGHPLTIVGLPKTVDNDIHPIRQSLGAATAAEHGAAFFSHVVAEHSANPRMLIVHEVMGRHCGWLTAATARAWRDALAARTFLPELGVSRARHDVHGVYLPEMTIDLEAEAQRIGRIMDELGSANIFISEGAGVDSIVAELEERGEPIPRDAFGHVKLDLINPGGWFGKQFATMIGAEKTLVQKSGYFARSAPANAEDLALIRRCTEAAVTAALDGVSGVIGEDEERGGELRPIELDRIRGGRTFEVITPWFQAMLAEIGQG